MYLYRSISTRTLDCQLLARNASGSTWTESKTVFVYHKILLQVALPLPLACYRALSETCVLRLKKQHEFGLSPHRDRNKQASRASVSPLYTYALA
jgi:hypothetical protein